MMSAGVVYAAVQIMHANMLDENFKSMALYSKAILSLRNYPGIQNIGNSK